MICRKTSITVCAFAMTAALAIVLLAGGAGAVPVEEWNRTFGGKDANNAYYVQQTSDNGYILTGSIFSVDYTKYSYGVGNDNALLIKTDAKGKIQWSKTFGGEGGNEVAYSVRQTSDGGYVLAGHSGGGHKSGDEPWIIKTDANGKEQFNITFWGGGSNDEAYSAQETSDGGYILAGYKYIITSFITNNDVWLIKTDAKGKIQWSKEFGGNGDDGARSVQQTSDGGYILAGWTNSYGDGSKVDYDTWLIKTDANGNMLWNKTFGGWSDNHKANFVRQTSDGGYILVGYNESFRAGELFPGYSKAGIVGNFDAWLIKTDMNGNLQWSKKFGGIGYDVIKSVEQISDGGYILAGFTNSSGAGNYDAWLIKTDTNGNELWNMTFGGLGWDEASSVQQTSDGGYIIAGMTSSYGSGKFDTWLIKVKDADTAPDINKPAEKSTPGFEMLGVILSVTIVLLLKRKRA